MKRQTVANSLRRQAKWMLEELEANYLHVVKVPTRHGYKRVVVQHNTYWYREFCKSWQRYKRPRRRRTETIVKRNHTIRGLKEIIAGYRESEYAKRLLSVVIGLMQQDSRPRRKVSA